MRRVEGEQKGKREEQEAGGCEMATGGWVPTIGASVPIMTSSCYEFTGRVGINVSVAQCLAMKCVLI